MPGHRGKSVTMDEIMHKVNPNDPATIDEIIARVWPEFAWPTLRLLVCHQTTAEIEPIVDYAKVLNRFLAGRMRFFEDNVETKADFEALAREAGHGYDLVVYGEPARSHQALFVPSISHLAVKELPTSVLIARQPHRPIRRILLLARGRGFDGLAADWLAHFAKSGQVAVTVLAVLPRAPAMYSHLLYRYGLANWLISNTPWGELLRRIDRDLPNWQVDGRLRFRSGSPDDQIRTEVEESDPDLIIVGADPDSWWHRRTLGAVADQLLEWIDRPVLVAKPAAVSAQQRIAEPTSGKTQWALPDAEAGVP